MLFANYKRTKSLNPMYKVIMSGKYPEHDIKMLELAGFVIQPEDVPVAWANTLLEALVNGEWIDVAGGDVYLHRNGDFLGKYETSTEVTVIEGVPLKLAVTQISETDAIIGLLVTLVDLGGYHGDFESVAALHRADI